MSHSMNFSEMVRCNFCDKMAKWVVRYEDTPHEDCYCSDDGTKMFCAEREKQKTGVK